MAIPYRTTKFKSANILAIAILGSTAKFNARQYFRLYELEQRPKRSTKADECSYHGLEHATIHLGYVIVHNYLP